MLDVVSMVLTSVGLVLFNLADISVSPSMDRTGIGPSHLPLPVYCSKLLVFPLSPTHTHTHRHSPDIPGSLCRCCHWECARKGTATTFGLQRGNGAVLLLHRNGLHLHRHLPLRILAPCLPVLSGGKQSYG